jgi:hypothetical protein
MKKHFVNQLIKTKHVALAWCYSTTSFVDEGFYVVATNEPIPDEAPIHMESSSSKGTILVVGERIIDLDSFSYWYYDGLSAAELYEIIEYLTQNRVELSDELVIDLTLLAKEGKDLAKEGKARAIS